MKYRQLGLIVAVLAALSMTLTGTAGFTGVEADRGVQVAVVDDDTAYLGVEQAPSNTTDGTADLNVTVTNRFPTGTELAVTVETGNHSAAVDIASGESRTVSVTSVDCDGQLAINGTGPAVSLHLDRPVECS